MSGCAEPAGKPKTDSRGSDESNVTTWTVSAPGYPSDLPMARRKEPTASEATSSPKTTSSRPSEDAPAGRVVAGRGASTRRRSVSALSPLDRFEAFVLGMIVGCNILLLILYVLTEHGWSFN